MSLLQEIQKSIVDPKINLSDILRNVKILAHRLQNTDLELWVDSEQKGYDNLEDLPNYRKLQTQSLGNFSGPFGRQIRNAPIFTTGLPKQLAEFAITHYFGESIKELEILVEQKEDIMRVPWPADYLLLLPEMYTHLQCMDAWKIISRSFVEGIIDTTRNKLLSFVLELEEIDPSAGDERNKSTSISQEQVSQFFQY